VRRSSPASRRPGPSEPSERTGDRGRRLGGDRGLAEYACRRPNGRSPLGRTLHAPHLLDLEVAQVLRRSALAAELDAARGAQALEDLAALPLSRYPHDGLLPRIWELRHTVPAYDAAYVALAEALAAPLVTRDPALAASRGPAARIERL
jgi:predicted nucleic acid-binding protein